MISPPRGLIEHDGRLDVLCCLMDDGPLTIPTVSARVGKSITAVAYLLDPLYVHGVVTRTGGQQGRQPLYEARLDEQPEWVRQAVAKHGHGRSGADG